MTYKVTEESIRRWTDDGSFSRGRRYYKQGAIIRLVRQENLLKARCRGSRPDPYDLWIQLGPHGIKEAECSCPVGSGGHCKHAVALLLTWLNDSDSFQSVEATQTILQRKQKNELITLIQLMIARYPDLEEMLHLQAGSAESDKPIDPDVIRRQVTMVLDRGDYGHDYYGSSASMAREVEAIMSQGHVYQQQGNWQIAADVYSAVLEELTEQYADVYDHDGDLFTIFYNACSRLEQCLEHIETADVRLPILKALVDVINLDVGLGGYGFSDDAYEAVLSQATASEREKIVEWVEAELGNSEMESASLSTWRRQAHGQFLLALQEDHLTDESFINICRRAHMLEPLLERLLDLDRIQEARADAQRASDFYLLQAADVFVRHGHEIVAEELVWERTGSSNDMRLDAWLKEHAVRQEKWDEAIAYAQNLFWHRPSIDAYRELQELCGKGGNWPEQRNEIFQRLQVKEQGALITRIHLLEGNVDEALKILAELPPLQAYGFSQSGGVAIEVAEAAEKTRPQEAIRLYKQRAERLIGARGRDNYATAADFLKRIRTLYGRLGQEPTWKTYLDEIRNQKPRLPAMLDEFKKAGL